MQIFNLLLHDGRTVLPRFAVTSGLASITNAAILMIVNFAAKTEYGTPPDAYLLVIFLGAMTGEAQTLSQAMNQTVIGFQAVLVTIVTGIYIAYLSWIAFALWALSV